MSSTSWPVDSRDGRWTNLPNAVTYVRILLVPALLHVLLSESSTGDIAHLNTALLSAGIVLAAAITDWLDGYLARRLHQISRLGQLLDPFADKLLISAGLLALVYLGVARAWVVGIIIGRELGITILRHVANSRGIALPASPLGKAKMALQLTALLLLVFARTVPAAGIVGQLTLYAALVTAVISAIDYVRRFRNVDIVTCREHFERREQKLA